MRKKLVGILLSACIVLGGFMTDSAVACAYDHGEENEYCEAALIERFKKVDQQCTEINSMFENNGLGVILEDGTKDPNSYDSSTKYFASVSAADAFMSACDTYMRGNSGIVKGWEDNGYFEEQDTTNNSSSNWSADGMLTSIKRSEMLEVITHMEAAIKPIWDVIHPKSTSSKSAAEKTERPRKSKAEKEREALEEAEKLKAEEERKALEEASRGSVRLEKEAAENGFANGAQMQDAKAKGKSADEYYNNAVVDTPGIENPVPVAQGGKLVVDGKTTNMTATIEKVSSIYVDSIRTARQGTVLNVVKVNYPAAEAVITFYMPGVQAGDVIMAVQYEGGLWTDVEVTEVRADHVTLSLKENGVVAFLK